jgi:hypothetical protein
MIHNFTPENIAEISRVLDAPSKQTGKVYRFSILGESGELRSALEIHIGLEMDDQKINIVSVYSHNVFLQLQNCTGFIASDTLQQVTFFGKMGGQTTGLILEKNGTINLYANVDDALLSGDFTKLPPEIMMCSVALSLTESLDFEGFSFDEDN